MKKGLIFIGLATVLFSSMEIALKTISGAINPIQLNLIRFFVGALLLLPSTVMILRRRKPTILLADVGFFALTGFIGITLSMILYQLSIMACKASIVAVIFSCNPVFMIPFEAFILREKIRPRTVVTMALSLAGMAAIIAPYFAHDAGTLTGILLTVLLAIAFALYSGFARTASAAWRRRR
jgi:drug/metabolite transporter (DMT)-like permease